jgi:PPOX class probable F420-dependent enzyme
MRPWSEVTRHFHTTAVGHLATLQEDGSPRVVPIWVDLHGESDVVFFAEATSVNARNVSRDPRVAISITNPEQALDMAAIRCEVVERIEGERGMQIVDSIARKYTGERYHLRSGVVAFIVRPTTWTARDYSG